MVPRLVPVIERARAAGRPVIYCCDAHLAGIDTKLRLHPDHALRGTWGAELAPPLLATDEDDVVTKRRSSAFFGTDLTALLAELETRTLVLTGVATHGCLQHTATSASGSDPSAAWLPSGTSYVASSRVSLAASANAARPK
jgi:nicotinamidase/pyrazinamidase